MTSGACTCGCPAGSRTEARRSDRDAQPPRGRVYKPSSSDCPVADDLRIPQTGILPDPLLSVIVDPDQPKARWVLTGSRSWCRTRHPQARESPSRCRAWMARGLTSLNSPIDKLGTLLRQPFRVYSQARLAPALVEKLLHDFLMIARCGPGKGVIAEPQITQILEMTRL